MFKIIFIVVVFLILGVLAYAATRPDSFRVERSADVQAPPEKIFPLINDLHRFADWSPYERKDPDMKRSYGGAPEGVGARYAWDGNKEIGQGNMEIIESSFPSKISMRLVFLEPFEAQNTAEFTLLPQGEFTRVTWAIHGPCPYVSKLMGLIFDMDQMIGKDFEVGLAQLKTLAES